jgi:cytochrome c oxidase assembly factor CtaG
MKKKSRASSIITTSCIAVLPVLLPAVAYWGVGGREVQWRLIVSGIAWALGIYTQQVAAIRNKKRFLIGSAILYIIACVFSFLTLGPLSVAFTVLFLGVITMLWVHKNKEEPSPVQLLVPYIAGFMGLVLTLGTAIITYAR